MRPLPTTPAGVEVCALAVFLGVRAVNLLQLAVALPTALRHTTSAAVFVAVLAGYTAESAALAAVTMRARRYASQAWGCVDTAVAAAVLLLQPAFVARADATGSWTAWGFALTLGSAAGAAIVFRRRGQIALAVALLSGCYLYSTLLLASTGSARATVVGNTFAYTGFAVLTRLLVGYLRRLAHDAEAAREAAAAAAGEAARLRHLQAQRLLLHDNIGLLGLLAQPDLPPELAGALRGQARELANRVRGFLNELGGERVPVSPGRSDGPCALTDAVHAAVRGFGDLPLELSVDLAEGVLLAPQAATAVTGAVATLLANVRLHADARLVVVHADADADTDTDTDTNADGDARAAAGAGGSAADEKNTAWWEVTVHDDGRGFDPAATPPGFGLREQVTGALAAHGISTHIRSVPGDGTSVTLRGPWTARP